MTQEDKKLFLKDLCARLSYGVHCCVLKLNKTIKEDNDIIYGIVGDNIVTLKSDKDECYMYYQIKPYLRPMSSMTEEERNEYFDIKMQEIERVALAEVYRPEAISIIMDWLNTHHFDYRELIEKGLALEAPEGMYNF